jgi:ubiquinone/menaquinone biosynthesis C-methylase UbiE
MRKIAQKKGIEVVNGVAEALPFDNNQFDYALMVTTICFLDDIETSFKEVFRVLKPRALFIIGFVDRNSPIGKVYQKRKDESMFYKEAKFYSVDDVASYLEKSGFRELSFMQTIYQDLGELKDIEPVNEGYGEGSFVVVRGVK